uniref:Uncharacterized protein n=1 Tax=Leersia perrieri TaxID=77586 RepID=A0A0D9W8L7_9ORYZ
MASCWAQLPDDLLDNVAQRTPGIKDYVRLRAVCKSWRSSLPPRSRTPWLMLPYDPSSEGSVRGFLDVADGTVHEIDLPETRGTRCCGSSRHGWLILERWPDVSLLNPATRERVQLPPLTRRRRVEAYLAPSRFLRRGATERWEDRASRGLRLPVFQVTVRAAAMSSDASVNGCTVVVVLHGDDEVAVLFCGPTDASWTHLACSTAEGGFAAVDVAWHHRRGAFHLVSHYGRVAVFDLVSPLREVPTRRDRLHALPPAWDGRCLVQRLGPAGGGGGDEPLLLATWSGGGEMAVFRLGSDGWWTEEADDVGEEVVLLAAAADSGYLGFGTATCAVSKGPVFVSPVIFQYG